jgi:hypothetical protein
MTEEETNDRPTSIVYDHCVRVYDEMAAQARREAVSNGPVALVYQGYLTKLFASLQLSVPYYTKVMDVLKSMGCLEQLRRGGGNSPSRWILIRRPEEDSFNSFINMKRTGKGRLAIAEQQIRDAHRRMNDMDSAIEDLRLEVQALWSKVGVGV